MKAYQKALEVYTRERAPLDWAMTQNNLANDLKNLGEWETGTEYLEQAVEACRVVLNAFDREESPQYHSMAETRLKQVLEKLR